MDETKRALEAMLLAYEEALEHADDCVQPTDDDRERWQEVAREARRILDDAGRRSA